MLANRLPLLSAFVVGCLSSAALIGFWRTNDAKRPPAVNPGARDRTGEVFVAPRATTSAVPDRATPDDGSGEGTAPPSRESAVGDEIDHGHNAAVVEPSSQPPRSEHPGVGAPTEPGSSVADALTHMEAAYRLALAVADQRDGVPGARRDLSPPGPGAAPGAADREPAAPPPTAETPPPAREEAAVAVADAPAPPKNALQADAQRAPWADPPVLAPPEDAPPRDAYVADARPNVYVGNLYQGDVYQVQQLAILQYIQLLAPMAGAGRGFSGRTRHEVTTRRPSPFPSSLVNPDNPWGFDLHPPVLVK